MSRCLPYGHQIYKREDVSLIGSIKKLQIQWGNTKKRKQVSRKVKETQNKKRSRVEHDKLDSLQPKNKKRKAEEKNIKLNESCHYSRKGDSYHLERSDLSEELDPPAFVLNKCNSSKCIQNCSKNNAVKDCNPSKNRPGMVIRIKLPLNKHKDLKPASASIDPCCSSQDTKSLKDQAFLSKSVLTESALRTKEVPSAKQLEICSEPCLSKSVLRFLTESALRTKEVPSAKQLEICAEPCFSGPVAKASILQEDFVEANPSESWHNSIGWSFKPRSERQLFRDLIKNWKPPSIQPIEADEAELDWLLAPKKSQDAKSSAQISKPGIPTPSACPSSANSLQPRAAYLPEFNMYQMPYVIPF